MKKYYTTKDKRLTIDLNEVKAMVKDEIETFDQKQNKNIIIYVISFVTENPTQVLYLTEDKEKREEVYEEILERLMEV